MSTDQILPPAVNFHLWKPCNLRCRFCYAGFDDDPALRAIRGGLNERDAMRVVELLRSAGAEKITLVGGEPTLCPYLPSLIRHCRSVGYTTTLVTNGKRLKHVLDKAPGCLDWVGLSVDSADEGVQAELGRGEGGHVAQSREHFRLLHRLGIRVKLNTVVTALNWQEDMTEFVLESRPDRWKVFQVLPVTGQNDHQVGPLLISRQKFDAYVERHRGVEAAGITLVGESNEAMTGSYAMIDPLGRFFSNVGGKHTYSDPILTVGVEAAFKSIDFSHDRFESRGGRYEWARKLVPLSVTAAGTRRPKAPDLVV